MFVGGWLIVKGFNAPASVAERTTTALTSEQASLSAA